MEASRSLVQLSVFGAAVTERLWSGLRRYKSDRIGTEAAAVWSESPSLRLQQVGTCRMWSRRVELNPRRFGGVSPAPLTLPAAALSEPYKRHLVCPEVLPHIVSYRISHTSVLPT